MEDEIPDPTGGEAARDAAESAKTGSKSMSITIGDVRSLIQLMGADTLELAQIAGTAPLWRVVRANETGHTFYSPALPLSKLFQWLDGWHVRDAEIREQIAETEPPA